MEREQFIYLDEIEIRGIWRDILLYWKETVLVVLSAMMFVNVYFELCYEPMYKSEATIALINTSSNSSSITDSASMAQALSQIFSSEILWSKVVEELQAEPIGKLDVRQIGNTNLISVEVTAPFAGSAYQELKLTLKHYAQISEYIFDNVHVSILSQPTIPEQPEQVIPKWKYTAAAALVGFCLSILLIVVLYLFRKTVKNKAMAERRLKAKICGTIVHEIKNKTLKQKIRKKNKAALISSPVCSRLFEESFNRTTSRILYHMNQHQNKVLLVTSGAENEGKSTVSANIALTMAKRGEKVLLLDADFRKPAVHKIFEYKQREIYGVEAYLQNQTSGGTDELIIHDKLTGVNLIMCSAGMRSPEPLLTSEKFRKLIRELELQYDYIILDTPAMGVAGDAEILAEYADVAIFAVCYDCQGVSVINHNLKNLKNSGIDLLGCVLNDLYGCVTVSKKKYAQYEYYNSERKKYKKFATKEHING